MKKKDNYAFQILQCIKWRKDFFSEYKNVP